jgi:hypothetical protein
MKSDVRRLFRAILLSLAWIVAIFLVMQVIPYGRTHSNPRVIKEPSWDTPRTRELAKRACFDCHSNETRWPWYANVAPFSWVVERDVNTAREVVNFSAWQVEQPLAATSPSSIRTGNMPPVKYRMAHPEANLTPEETQALANGLEKSLQPD